MNYLCRPPYGALILRLELCRNHSGPPPQLVDFGTTNPNKSNPFVKKSSFARSLYFSFWS